MQSEWYKLRKSKISAIILAGPLIGLFIGLSFEFPNMDASDFNWYMTLMMMNLTYCLLFLPLMTGVLAGLICRYEHQAGGWKQLLALPVKRSEVFLSKYAVLLGITFLIQILYLCAVYTVGMLKGYTDPFPLDIIWKSILGGWIATFPLIAFQLWMSMVWNHFSIPFAINVIFTLPTIMVVNSERFGVFYPWAQPFLMMYVGGDTDDIFYVPWDQVLTVVGGSFILFFLGGLWYFKRKAI